MSLDFTPYRRGAQPVINRENYEAVLAELAARTSQSQASNSRLFRRNCALW
jgi:hypothetical protein